MTLKATDYDPSIVNVEIMTAIVSVAQAKGESAFDLALRTSAAAQCHICDDDDYYTVDPDLLKWFEMNDDMLHDGDIKPEDMGRAIFEHYDKITTVTG